MFIACETPENPEYTAIGRDVHLRLRIVMTLNSILGRDEFDLHVNYVR